MKSNCKVCNKPAMSDYCFMHKPRTAIKKSRTNKVPFSSEKGTFKSEAKDGMKLLFISLWKNTPKRSEISDTYLGNSFSSAFFHHILPKSKYPEAMNDLDNIIKLTMDEHANVENNMYRYEEINRRREILKTKYDI